MHKAHIAQHQLRRAVLVQTKSDDSRETLKKPVKPIAKNKKPITSKDKKITKKAIHD